MKTVMARTHPLMPRVSPARTQRVEAVIPRHLQLSGEATTTWEAPRPAEAQWEANCHWEARPLEALPPEVLIREERPQAALILTHQQVVGVMAQVAALPRARH